MLYILEKTRRLLSSLWDRLWQLLQAAPVGSVQVTGAVGLIALLVGYYQLRGNNQNGDLSRRLDGEDERRRGSAHLDGMTRALGKPVSSTIDKGSVSSLPLSPLELSIRSKLTGVRRLTITVPGVLIEENSANQLQEAVTMKELAMDIMKHVLLYTDVYLVAQVLDEVAQAVVLGTLEASGLVGREASMIPCHRVLFCSTSEGKVAIVRQLDPDLHIDGDAETVEALKRFIPLLLHIPASGNSLVGGTNVQVAPSLDVYFN